MAVTITPTDYFPGYLQKTSDGSGNITGAAATTDYILFKISDFPELSTAEAQGSDIRKIMFGVIDGIYQKYAAVQAGSSDVPTRWVASKQSTFLNNNSIRSYTNNFETSPTAEDVVGE
tara:strand:- start:291 stop:644 length:354 start_codon:yes stop_codon:yes gene_type:complete